MKILMKRTRIGWALGLGALNGCHGRARLLPVLALFLSVTGSAGAQQRNIRFTRLSVEKGPSQSVVNCIFHDRRGFMWFGSEDGLNGFDVYRFTAYKHDRQDPASLAYNFVPAIHEGRDRVLWVGTKGGGLSRYNRHRGDLTHFKNDPPDPASLSGDDVRGIPPPWRSWWAYGIYTLILASALVAYARVQQRKLEREAGHSRELEREVHARTEELAQRNKELELLNEKLEEASLTDSLTGLRNRRYFLNYIERDVSLVLREYVRTKNRGNGGPAPHLVFLMIDLDRYKSINDHYGHSAGDLVLMQVREILERACRSSETLVRWGGDEFLVTGRVSDQKSSRILAERIRRMIEEHPFQIGGGKVIHTTCSTGFACFPFLRWDREKLGWEQVLTIADRALYVAKNTRRNAWVGIFANERAGQGDLFESILGCPEHLIEEGSLEVLSSIPKDWKLDWGDKARAPAGQVPTG